MTYLLNAFDSDNIDDIPISADIVNYYNDGLPGTPNGVQLSRFTHQGTLLLPITRIRNVAAYWIDVENGAATMDDAADSLARQLVKGVYANVSTLESSNVELPNNPQFWLASWNGAQRPGFIPGNPFFIPMVQWLSPTSDPPSAGHYDVSWYDVDWYQRLKGTGMAQLNRPIIAVAHRPQNDGYWLVAQDGGIFQFGAAPFFAGNTLPQVLTPGHLIVDAFSSPTGEGLTLIGSDGGVFTFGDATFYGSLPGVGIGESTQAFLES